MAAPDAGPGSSPAPAEPPPIVDVVVGLSRRYGADPAYARGGGGNSSAKADGVLWIKPSGVSLAALTPAALMPLAIDPLLAALDGPLDEPGAAGSAEVLRVALAARLHPDDERRPSVEAMFHALLPDPLVLHLHPTLVNGLTCAVDGRAAAAELFGDAALWIPYVDPGLPLARRIAAERAAFSARTGRPAPAITFLASHGLIVTGPDAATIDAAIERVVQAIAARVDRTSTPVAAPDPAAGLPLDRLAEVLRRRREVDAPGSVVLVDDGPEARRIAGTREGLAFAAAGALTPDQIVYAGSVPLVVEGLPPAADEAAAVLGTAIDAHAAATGALPGVVVIAGSGLLVAGDAPGLAANARDVILDAWSIARAAAAFGGARPLTPSERRFIEEWEAEDYRRGVAASPS